jgi:hypothetical protein
MVPGTANRKSTLSTALHLTAATTDFYFWSVIVSMRQNQQFDQNQSRSASSRSPDLHPPKMLQDGRMAGLVTLHRVARPGGERQVWAESRIVLQRNPWATVRVPCKSGTWSTVLG